jgi:hypothetical protein
MKTYVLAGFLALGVLTISAQEASGRLVTIEKGDTIQIGNPSTSNYKHIKFPRANFIMKRGNLANYKTIVGEDVIVTNVVLNEDGTSKVDVKRKNGRKFFNTLSTVTINFEDALEAGEVNYK